MEEEGLYMTGRKDELSSLSPATLASMCKIYPYAEGLQEACAPCKSHLSPFLMGH